MQFYGKFHAGIQAKKKLSAWQSLTKSCTHITVLICNSDCDNLQSLPSGQDVISYANEEQVKLKSPPGKNIRELVMGKTEIMCPCTLLPGVKGVKKRQFMRVQFRLLLKHQHVAPRTQITTNNSLLKTNLCLHHFRFLKSYDGVLSYNLAIG